MEKRIQTKIDDYTNEFKNTLIQWINEQTNLSTKDISKDTITNTDKDTSTNTDKDNSTDKTQKEENVLFQQIINIIKFYPTLSLSQDDFSKRKRTKNNIPLFDRCKAKRANNSQCTRRKKNDCDFCGTHQKGQPHGLFDEENMENIISTRNVVVSTINIEGINYFGDNDGNLYFPQDVLNNKLDPKKIGKYELNVDGSGEEHYKLLEIFE